MNIQRNTRGSFVFAGSFENELLSAVEQPVKCVHSVFDVIGELATCCASDPIEAVIVDDSIISADTNANIDAMRRVDPTVTIVISGDNANYAQADAVIPKTTTAARLTSAIANVHAQPAAIELPSEIDLDEILGISDDSPFVKDNSPLGDIDLVRALMHSPMDFRKTLVDLLKQQTGWSFCAIVDDQSGAPKSSQSVPLRYGRQEHGYLAAIGATQSDLVRWARWAGCWLELIRKQRELKLLAYQDELSGAWNRRFLRTCFTRELQIASESRRPLTVMIFDIDDFKHYNDRWGHEAGDDIIREIVRLLRTIIRKGDHVCRIGGDEFAVLFCDPAPPRESGSNHPTSIEILAKRFRDQVAQARFPKLGEEASGILSISGGLATFPWDGVDVDDILRKADERLLQSKRQGKNSITIGHEE